MVASALYRWICIVEGESSFCSTLADLPAEIASRAQGTTTMMTTITIITRGARRNNTARASHHLPTPTKSRRSGEATALPRPGGSRPQYLSCAIEILEPPQPSRLSASTPTNAPTSSKLAPHMPVPTRSLTSPVASGPEVCLG